MFVLKDILAKELKDLSDEEKTFLAEHASELTDEQAKSFEITKEVNEELDTKGLDELVNLSVEKEVKSVVNKMVAVKRGEINMASETLPTNGKWAKKTLDWCVALTQGDLVQMKALTTSSSDTPKAGYTIPSELFNEIIRLVEDVYGVARREMRYLPFSGPGDTRDITALGSSVSMTWTDEAVAKTATQPVFDRVQQTLKKLACIIPMTEELLQDTAINLPGLLADLVAEATAKEEDEQFFDGVGAPWTGIVNNGSITPVVMTAALGFADITAENLLDMQDAGLVGAHNGAKYFMHRTIFSYVRKLREDSIAAGDGLGAFIYQRPQGEIPGTIWNYPFELVEGMPDKDDDAINKGFVIFGNLKRYAIYGDKGGMQVKILTEATITDTDGQTSINLGQQDMIAYRFVERVGYVLPKPTAIVVLKTSGTIS